MANLKDIGYGVGKYLVASDASDIPDIGTNRKNVDLLNFKVATNNAYALYNFKDGMIDAYQDQTGVDTDTSTGEVYDSSGKYYTSQQSLVENNYSYTGSTTTLAVVTGNTYTVKTWGAGGGNGAQNEAGWLAGAAGGYSTGTYSFGANTTLVISSGGAGLKGNQASTGGFGGGGPRGAPFYNNTSGGANGGGYSGVFVGSVAHANTLQMAGGGGGGYYYGPHGGAVAGGGGGSSGTNSAGGSSGGTQSAGGTQSGGGSGSALQGGTGGNGADGIGGAGGGGGYYGGAGSGGYGNGGGSGGGGSGFVALTATINSVAVTAESAGSTTASVGTSMNSTGSSDSKYPGSGIGNEQTNGAVYISYAPASAMTLISNTQAAQAAPTEGRLMLYEEDVDAITLNTDIKGYVSRDGGTTYTQTPLALDSNITHPASLLLHCDGSNDGTTFTDSSYWQLPVIVGGATHTDTAVKKFGTASAQFAGTTGNDYLEFATTSGFGLGTGDWTIDWWCRSPNWGAGSGYGYHFDMRGGVNSLGSPYVFTDTGNNNRLGFGPGTGGTKCSSNVDMVNDTWYHIAVVKYNNVTKMYTNGVTGASGTYPTEYADTTDYKTTNPLRIGDTSHNGDPYAFNGYIDEFRVTKGIARWTANFTPDTSPYTGTEGDTRILSGSVDISGQPSGTDMKYKVETLNNKNLKLHGASLLWA